jgi:2-amino-4-hydroxy-6-hydroxymethyldihydropteridine diphosphokinase
VADTYIALGANLGDREANLRTALQTLAKETRRVAVSALYQTDAVTADGSVQPRYLNAACLVETHLDPLALLQLLQAIERDLGRESTRERWAPRPIDLDILIYDDLVLDDDRLTIPHPRLAVRPFVLIPLNDIAAEVIHPVLCRTVADLAREAGTNGVRRITGPEWASPPVP